MWQANMKLLIFTINIVFIGCLVAAPVSVNDPLHRIQQEMEELKRSNEESIAALKQTYDEKIRTYDEKIRTYDEKIRTYDQKIRRNDQKIAGLEQQLRWKTNPQSGPCLLIFLVVCQRQRRSHRVPF